MVERLRVHIAAGLSASQTAARINAELRTSITRNAVISKMHRLGLGGTVETPRRTPGANRAGGRVRAAQMRKPGSQTKPMPKPQMFEVKDELDPIPVGERHGLLRRGKFGYEANDAVNEHTCRWPIGDPRSKDFHFCNRERTPGVSYCEFHSRKAYQPVEVKLRKVAKTKDKVLA